MDRLEELLNKINIQNDLRPLLKAVEPIDTAEDDNSLIKHDPTRLKIDLGDRSIYVFGRTKAEEWQYFCTIYFSTGAPAGAVFWCSYEESNQLIAHIRSQLAIAKASGSGPIG
jgi:hypothetical protein